MLWGFGLEGWGYIAADATLIPQQQHLVLATHVCIIASGIHHTARNHLHGEYSNRCRALCMIKAHNGPTPTRNSVGPRRYSIPNIVSSGTTDITAHNIVALRYDAGVCFFFFLMSAPTQTRNKNCCNLRRVPCGRSEWEDGGGWGGAHL